ncbi:methyltransferase-like protein 9 isoform X1 [Dinothrombium tinctorium]|uniref:Methyltransferase-like protein 9 isoform X1 n=1 Tax=Dinothrombium tinctorium TaxID=1965070 RepID=A0A443QWF5_9ACAR|nr:methyltransferase-like protein 9 isoform X1 [Dinothrombium tinctorium]
MSSEQWLRTRPAVIRGSFARSLFEKMMREQQLRSFDRRKWYTYDKSAVSDALQSKFIEMMCDSETNDFIESCYNKSEWVFTHLFQAIARTFLCLFMTSTSVNGLLGRGSMFIFSRQQITTFHEDLLCLKADPNSTLLDLGAGDGEVTTVLSNFFNRTFVTEVSPVMRRILTKKGFKTLDAFSWQNENIDFDLISCLNLLDRCDKPLTMLKHIRTRLKPNGRLLLALVLPFSQYVESSSNKHKPSEQLPITGTCLESQLISFHDNVIKPYGFELIKWTKLPYLCEGDLELSFYWLNDIVMLLKAVD